MRKIFLLLFLILTGCRSNNSERKIELHFESLKQRGDGFLINYFKDFPKGGDLHVHLSGAIAPKEWLKAAELHHLYYLPSTFEISDQPLQGFLEIKKLKNDFEWENFYSKVSLRTEEGFPIEHDVFFGSYQLIRRLMKYIPLEEFIPVVLHEAKSNAVQYVELMVGAHLYPTYFTRDFPLDDVDQAYEILKPSIDEFIANVQFFLNRSDEYGKKALDSSASIFSSESPVTVRYIIEISRDTEDLQKFYYRALAAFKLIQADDRVRSINIVGTEDAPLGIDNFEAQMKIIDDLSRYHNIYVNLHAGELTLPCGTGSYLLTERISSTLSRVRNIQRIGHASSFPWDRNPFLSREIKTRNITIEVCPSSNQHILQLQGTHHPIHLFLQQTLPVVIATDDPGISNTSLTNEYVLVAKWAPYLTHQDFKNMAIESLEASFLDGEGIYSKNDRGYQLNPAFKSLSSLPKEALLLLNESEKARVEYKHALQMKNFEEQKIREFNEGFSKKKKNYKKNCCQRTGEAKFKNTKEC